MKVSILFIYMFWNKRMAWRKGVYADAAGGVPPHASPSALHHEGVLAARALLRARAEVAKAIGAHPDEIVFVSGSTEANNWVATQAKSNAVCLATEHVSVLEPLRARGALLEVGVNSEGLVNREELLAAVRPDTALVSVQLVNSEVGSVQPIRDIAKALKRQYPTLLVHTDATQAIEWLPIDMQKIPVDLMTLGEALYIRRGVALKPLLLGGGQERGLRAGTPNVPAAEIFARWLHEAQQDVETRAERVAAVRDYCWAEIKKLLPDAILNGPNCYQGDTLLTSSKVSPCRRVANNLNISIPGLEAQMAVIALDALGVAASTRSACDVGSEEPSHVIRALRVPRELAGTAIRFTFLPDFSRREARRVAVALKEVAERYRQR